MARLFHNRHLRKQIGQSTLWACSRIVGEDEPVSLTPEAMDALDAKIRNEMGLLRLESGEESIAPAPIFHLAGGQTRGEMAMAGEFDELRNSR